jgi:hypothetical protein
MSEKKPSKLFLCFLVLFTVILLAIDIYLISFLLNPWDFSASYATYEEAVKDGAVKRGWIPKFMPADAYNIRESHNLSPADQHLEFSFKSSEQFKTIIDTYQYIPQNLNEKEHIKTFTMTPVQPDIFKFCPASNTNDQLSYYKIPEREESCLIVNWTSKHAYCIYRCCKGK